MGVAGVDFNFDVANNGSRRNHVELVEELNSMHGYRYLLWALASESPWPGCPEDNDSTKPNSTVDHERV
jgi:hypothetical protein